MKNTVYLGIKGSVIAIDRDTGQERWRCHLKSRLLTTLVVQENVIIAHTKGSLFGINKDTGSILWNNPLTGLGYGHCIIAGGDQNTSVVIDALTQEQATAGAGAG